MPHLRLLCLTLVLSAACAADEDPSAGSGDDPSGERDPNRSDDAGRLSSVDAGNRAPTLDASARNDAAGVSDQLCEQIQTANRVLLGGAQLCTRDEDCTMATIEAPCISAFLCPVAVRAGLDLAPVRMRASTSAAGYPMGCPCPKASCAEPMQPNCDLQAMRCRLGSGASAADAGS